MKPLGARRWLRGALFRRGGFMDQRQRPIPLDHWIVAILLFIMAAIAFTNILSRYLFHFSFAATEEITINLFVWMTVVGTGIAFERGGQLGMVTLFNLFPKQFQRQVIVIGSALNALLFLLVDYFIIASIHDELTLFQARSPSLNIPVWIYYAGVPVLSFFVFRGIYHNAIQRLQA
jgi:TRAP-type C4-dicarboxylate transport system permease small subunit